MRTLLYLDSARMGLMSPRARRAHLDYTRLAGREGCSLYFERLLRDGFRAWPRELRDRYAGLNHWQGIDELQRAVRRIVDLPPGASILMANRTAQLTRLAVRCLVRRASRILLTDLTWPSYRRILERERQRSATGVTTVPIAEEILYRGATGPEIVQRIVQQYERMNCDGVLLPAVSHLGIRLPVDTICGALSEVRPPRFIVVDAAQAFCHVSTQLGLAHCDMLLCGTHKWLGGHVPMGLAFCPREPSAAAIEQSCRQMLMDGDLDDPLLALLRQISDKRTESFGETVNLASLFTCRGALSQQGRDSIGNQFTQRLANAQIVAKRASRLGWTCVMPAPDLRSGILLLRHEQLLNDDSNQLRSFFLAHAVAVTTYDEGLVRLSMPERPWQEGELDLLCWALRHAVCPCRSQNVVAPGKPYSISARGALSEANI